MLQFGGLVAIANTSLALLAVTILWYDPSSVWLLAVPLITLFLAYRAYISEREKHERLEMLYRSSRILQHSPELDVALLALLDHAREMFRAELAEVVLDPQPGFEPGPAHHLAPRRSERGDGARRPDRPPARRRAGDLEPPAGLLDPRPDAGRPGDGDQAGDDRAARRRVGHDRHADDRQPPDRRHEVRGRRPAPPRDAGQPGRRGPRERPAGAVPGRARRGSRTSSATRPITTR